MGTMTEKDWKGVTWFRKANALECPTETWFLKALNVDASSRRNEFFKMGPDDNMLVGTAVWAPQCAICLERPGGAGNHEHTQCPLVGTLNKIRQQGELKPLRFLGRTLFREDEKVDLNMPTEMHANEERLDKLKKAHAASAAPPHGLGQGKKRKPEDGGNSGVPPAKKGKGGGGQGNQGKPASGAQQGGKGKAFIGFLVRENSMCDSKTGWLVKSKSELRIVDWLELIGMGHNLPQCFGASRQCRNRWASAVTCSPERGEGALQCDTLHVGGFPVTRVGKVGCPGGLWSTVRVEGRISGTTSPLSSLGSRMGLPSEADTGSVDDSLVHSSVGEVRVLAPRVRIAASGELLDCVRLCIFNVGSTTVAEAWSELFAMLPWSEYQQIVKLQRVTNASTHPRIDMWVRGDLVGGTLRSGNPGEIVEPSLIPNQLEKQEWPSPPGLNLRQLNVNGFPSKREQVSEFLEKERITVCALQETLVSASQYPVCFPGFRTYARVWQEGFRGQAVLVSSDLPSYEVPHAKESMIGCQYLLHVKVATIPGLPAPPCSLHFVGVYLPSGGNMRAKHTDGFKALAHLYDGIMRNENSALVVAMGDFNALPLSWSPPTCGFLCVPLPHKGGSSFAGSHVGFSGGQSLLQRVGLLALLCSYDRRKLARYSFELVNDNCWLALEDLEASDPTSLSDLASHLSSTLDTVSADTGIRVDSGSSATKAFFPRRLRNLLKEYRQESEAIADFLQYGRKVGNIALKRYLSAKAAYKKALKSWRRGEKSKHYTRIAEDFVVHNHRTGNYSPPSPQQGWCPMQWIVTVTWLLEATLEGLNAPLLWKEAVVAIRGMNRDTAPGVDRMHINLLKAMVKEECMLGVYGPDKEKHLDKSVRALPESKIPKSPLSPMGKALWKVLTAVWALEVIPEEWSEVVIVNLFKKGDPELLVNISKSLISTQSHSMTANYSTLYISLSKTPKFSSYYRELPKITASCPDNATGHAGYTQHTSDSIVIILDFNSADLLNFRFVVDSHATHTVAPPSDSHHRSSIRLRHHHVVDTVVSLPPDDTDNAPLPPYRRGNNNMPRRPPPCPPSTRGDDAATAMSPPPQRGRRRRCDKATTASQQRRNHGVVTTTGTTTQPPWRTHHYHHHHQAVDNYDTVQRWHCHHADDDDAATMVSPPSLTTRHVPTTSSTTNNNDAAAASPPPLPARGRGRRCGGVVITMTITTTHPPRRPHHHHQLVDDDAPTMASPPPPPVVDNNDNNNAASPPPVVDPHHHEDDDDDAAPAAPRSVPTAAVKTMAMTLRVPTTTASRRHVPTTMETTTTTLHPWCCYHNDDNNAATMVSPPLDDAAAADCPTTTTCSSMTDDDDAATAASPPPPQGRQQRRDMVSPPPRQRHTQQEGWDQWTGCGNS
ncbi:hypothetical protein EV363DRAFT_1300186 [Boletus edulis]|nr:hypothetical protein EV363DRAFT_1300186 [Boletus edulis]